MSEPLDQSGAKERDWLAALYRVTNIAHYEKRPDHGAFGYDLVFGMTDEQRAYVMRLRAALRRIESIAESAIQQRKVAA